MGNTSVTDIQAVIFDLDGTLIDSEKFYYKADHRLMKEYGIDLTPEIKNDYGCGNLDMMRMMKDRFFLQDSPETLLKKKNDYYMEMARNNTVVYPKTFRLLKKLNTDGYPLALASGSSPEVLKELLENTGLKDYFTLIISSEEVDQGKPDPQIFLESAHRLNILPQNCVVIEDSPQGVEAAKRAFMMCIAIPSIIKKPLHENFLLADLLFENGMESFDDIIAFRWIKNRAGSRS